jgi:hypothetical protein
MSFGLSLVAVVLAASSANTPSGPVGSLVGSRIWTQPADYQPLRQVGDGTRLGKLHRRCEVPWAYGEPSHSICDASLTAGSSAFA